MSVLTPSLLEQLTEEARAIRILLHLEQHASTEAVLALVGAVMDQAAEAIDLQTRMARAMTNAGGRLYEWGDRAGTVRDILEGEP